MNVLVTGGAGYIGSHAVKQLIDGGHRVIVADNLHRGHAAAVHSKATFVHTSVHDTPAMTRLMAQHEIDCVMHFAALTYVGESVEMPLNYYENNTVGTHCLLRAIRETGVKRLVFSSTAATYGEPRVVPIVESTPQEPINPYGASKWMSERMIRDWAATDETFAFTILRYFNVAGCAADGSIGEHHDPETHIIPLLLQTALGQRETFTIFGEDYATPDGTCIRDYVHVEDLCHAHLLAMKAMRPGDGRIYNVGLGHGFSVRQVLEAARQVTQRDIRVVAGQRRPGDPAQLFTNSDLLQRELQWRPHHENLEDIIATAWQWFQAHPHGYAGQPH